MGLNAKFKEVCPAFNSGSGADFNNAVYDLLVDIVARQAELKLIVDELVADHATSKTTVDGLDALTDELHDDHATSKVTVDGLDTLTDELHDDHATFKVTVDGLDELTDELHDDHATFKTTVDGLDTLTDELHDDHATFKTVVDDIKTLVNDIRAKLKGCYVLSPTALDVGSTPQNVYNSDFWYVIGGGMYKKDEVAAGTALSGDNVPEDAFGAWRLEVGADGDVDIVPATDNATGYASAELAIAGLPAVSADHASLGVVTAMNDVGVFQPGITSLSDGDVTATYTDADTMYDEIGSAVSSSTPDTLASSKVTAGPETLAASKVTAGPETLSASKVTAGPETLTASKVTAGPETLTASKVTAGPATLTNTTLTAISASSPTDPDS